jgi:hypothetical protein
MAGEYKSACGCKIHVIQWSAKRKVVTQESCSLHKAASVLLAAAKKAVQRNCVCKSSTEKDWHSADCAMPDLRAAIILAEGVSGQDRSGL